MKIIELSNNCDRLTACELLAGSRGIRPWTRGSCCAACRQISCVHAPDLIADLSR